MSIYRQANQPEFIGKDTAVATLSQSIPESIDLHEELYYQALLIYQSLEDAVLGKPVCRIEILSPSNKRGECYLQYREKRYAALKSGLALVELYFLHETAPVIRGLPAYPQTPNAYAYNITVSEPFPDFDNGKVDTYAFGVEMPIPEILVPLEDGKAFKVDINALYNEVYESLTAYSRRVDYAQLPLNFDKYSSVDKQRIQALMQRISKQVEQGISLEN